MDQDLWKIFYKKIIKLRKFKKIIFFGDELKQFNFLMNGKSRKCEFLLEMYETRIDWVPKNVGCVHAAALNKLPAAEYNLLSVFKQM